MHVYFVRHGATQLNTRHRHQSPSTPLSLKGRDEVLTVAEYLRAMNPDCILTSEYTRAQETARIIGMHVGLTPVTNGLFYEIVRPSKLYEKSLFNATTFCYVVLSVLNHKNPRWRYSDAENFNDITARAKKALTYIESLCGSHKSVVIVSHTVFINIMVSYMCKNRMLDIRDLALTFLHIERMKNGGVIHVEYVGKSKENVCSWRIIQ